MASKDSTPTSEETSLPFGAIREDGGSDRSSKKRRRSRRKKPARDDGAPAQEGREGEDASRASGSQGEGGENGAAPRNDGGSGEGQPGPREGRRRSRRGGRKRRGRGGQRSSEERQGGQGSQGTGAQDEGGAPREGGGEAKDGAGEAVRTGAGMFVLDKGGVGVLRRAEAGFRQSKEDIYVPKRLIQSEKLRDGAIVEGRISRGQKHKYQLNSVDTVDGRDPRSFKNLTLFKNLTSIDPDFHYAVGDITGEVSMRIVDLLCPIGRGQRGLIVAPPRSGKTTLMRQFAAGIEKGYPDVHLMVLLVDERPEEATEWKRNVERAQVFVSTADETAKNHIQTAEAVWLRAQRLVELGEDVIILLDSITRLARAYNNQAGSGGRTMSGGLDSRAMERPRKIFGSARNTETAGSLTILGTTLIETGSRLDQLVFEEFKGTGNMELVLSRKLADRRIFPAIDVERSGTRKEEKLVGMRRLKLIHTLRRVLSRMSFIEAMDLLITKLDDVEKTDDFLARFEVDPDA